jgi:4-alpha-glucanotransferase
MSAPDLDALAAHAGVFERYWDLAGAEHVASVDTKRALLRAMGLDVERPAEQLSELRAGESARPVPPALVVPADRTTTVDLRSDAREWTLIPDPRVDTGPAEGHARDRRIDLPPLPVGLHRLAVDGVESLLIAAPPTAPDLASLGLPAPRWGVTAPLYGLRSERGVGVGTYADLADAARALAGQGADFLGINPVHALGTAPHLISPYSPSHRGFFTTDHITPPNGSAEGKTAGAIDRDAVRAELHRQLRAAHRDLGSTQRAALAAFRLRGGEALQRFATFEALCDVHGVDWHHWPTALRDPKSSAVRRFRETVEGEIDYHAYLQFLADAQLADAQRAAREAGMALGLYTDLAVGVRPDGAEVWAEPGSFARGVSLGSPPDQFNPLGQVWGLAPTAPLGLADWLYQPFIDALRATFRHAGIARIDHVLGFMRCFWVPENGAAGGYVRYPTEILLAIVRVEATHAGCLIIGEDLGVLPDGLQERLAESRLYGCSVVQFERANDGDVRHPRDFRPHTLASFATHDTPTVRGFWTGWDIERRVGFGQLDAADAQAAHQRRDWDRRRLNWLADGTTGEPSPDLDAAGVARMHALLATAACDLIAVQLDDLYARVEQANFPGTVDEYPNWRLKCPVTVAALQYVPALEPIRRTVDARRSGET